MGSGSSPTRRQSQGITTVSQFTSYASRLLICRRVLQSGSSARVGVPSWQAERPDEAVQSQMAIPEVSLGIIRTTSGPLSGGGLCRHSHEAGMGRVLREI